jgi:hypothetical protein
VKTFSKFLYNYAGVPVRVKNNYTPDRDIPDPGCMGKGREIVELAREE